MIVSGALNLLGQVVGLFGARGAEKQAQLEQRIAAMDRTWTDEIIVVVFIAIPAGVAWFDPVSLQGWITAIFDTNELYSGLVLGITAAVFGLGKIKKR